MSVSGLCVADTNWQISLQGSLWNMTVSHNLGNELCFTLSVADNSPVRKRLQQRM